MGLGHPWVEDHPDYFVGGTEADLARAPQNYLRVQRKKGEVVLAHGRDPYFAGWPDTLQLNYANPATHAAMNAELLRISGQCDGVRCDMAMLILPDVFQRTWGMRPEPFWPLATRNVRAQFPDFCFMAEVYWDLEWTLQQQGFDYAYDKRLYDRLREHHARPEAILEGVLAMMACKAAVKAGQPLRPQEIEALLERRHLVQNTHHCPHGRPTALTFTKAELERQFGRTGPVSAGRGPKTV
jgi:hypothetical protein